MRYRISIFYVILHLIVVNNSIAMEAKKFFDWQVEEDEHKGYKSCYAHTNSFRTKCASKVLDDNIHSTLTIKKSDNKQYSIGAHVPHTIDKPLEVFLLANNNKRLLRYVNEGYIWSYSDISDVNIIGDLLLDGRFATLSYHSTECEETIDYFSSKGLADAIRYMEKNCSVGWQGIDKANGN